MAAKLKRVSVAASERIEQLRQEQHRTFVAQVDVLIDAGLQALGHPPLDTTQTEPTPATADT